LGRSLAIAHLLFFKIEFFADGLDIGGRLAEEDRELFYAEFVIERLEESDLTEGEDCGWVG
jgi:hypothetical protein